MNYKLLEQNDDFDGNEVIQPSNQGNFENAKLFLNKSKLFLKKYIIEVFSLIFLIIINIVLFFQFEKPYFGDTCYHNITSNSTCHHQFICGQIDEHSYGCRYMDVCDECFPVFNWTLIILVLNCLPSALLWSCLETFYPQLRLFPWSLCME